MVKESCFDYTVGKNISKKSYGFVEKQYKTFLRDADTKNYFELLNLPLNSSLNNIEEAYRNMVKIFHPDRRDRNMPAEITKLCDQCFFLVNKIYQTLIDPNKKEQYLKKLVADRTKDSFTIRATYVKGKTDLEKGCYAESLKQFESIFNSRFAPEDTVLFYIWSIIKHKKLKDPIDQKEENKIVKLFDSVGLEHRQSSVFFFVKGLFMRASGNTDAARNYFTKALLLDSKLTVARVEKHSLGSAQKKSLKSFMDLFKKIS